jgi:hypothetical protein
MGIERKFGALFTDISSCGIFVDAFAIVINLVIASQATHMSVDLLHLICQQS